jgi:hypothetical protein
VESVVYFGEVDSDSGEWDEMTKRNFLIFPEKKKKKKKK